MAKLTGKMFFHSKKSIGFNLWTIVYIVVGILVIFLMFYGVAEVAKRIFS